MEIDFFRFGSEKEWRYQKNSHRTTARLIDIPFENNLQRTQVCYAIHHFLFLSIRSKISLLWRNRPNSVVRQKKDDKLIIF